MAEANPKPSSSVLRYFVHRGASVSRYRIFRAEKACYRSGGRRVHSNEFSIVAKCFYLLAAIGTFALAFLSLYDAYKAKQGQVKEITLQLPKSLKQRIHKAIREQTRTSGVIIGALVIGFAISALELVCTGQVYLPTITFVMGVEGMRRHALAYLILYNLMFIVPLVVVFGFVYWGTTSMQLGGVLQRHLMPVKVGTGVLLFGLGAWLFLNVL